LQEIDPNNLQVQIIKAAMDYRLSVEDENDGARSQVVRLARSYFDPTDPNRILSELVLDDHLRNQQFSAALTSLDTLVAKYPESQRYWRQRLQVLIATGDQTAIEAQLLDLVERFPEDIEQKAMLVRYYLSRGEIDKTENFLREQVAMAPEGDSVAQIDLIKFLLELRSLEDARAEIADAIETGADRTPFVMLAAALDFTSGNTEQAISALEAEIESAEPSDGTNGLKISLSRMLLATGNEVGARSLVESVLLDDGTQVGALKMNAAWLTEVDDTDGAIAALRTALDQDPDDPEALTLMATAYARTGSRDLERDFLALAAEASGNAPAETVRYVQLLIAEERFLPAEDVLFPALRIAPYNLELLQTAAQLYLGMEDEGRMMQVIETLRQIETPEAAQLAIQLEANRLTRSNGVESALGYLEGIANVADADYASSILLLRGRLAAGDIENAIKQAEGILADAPDTPSAKLVLATTLAAVGELDRSLELYIDLAEQFPTNANLQLEIATLYVRKSEPETARTTISSAIEANPNNARLMWVSASYMEFDGDIDGAIAVYEEMYSLNSSDIVVANNLASLISEYRTDDASLERAWTIARRFSDTERPAIQDTYGWISHRRGNSQEALPFLEAAAAGLPDDPIVQFHLAEVLLALGQTEEALAQYRISLNKAAIVDSRPQFDTARERITELENTVEAAD
jgi:tetratricopeptide (TPR) repeat protein